MKERAGPDSWTEERAERRRVSKGGGCCGSLQHRLPCRQELGVIIWLNPQVVEAEIRNPFEFSRGAGGEGGRLMELEVSLPEGDADR